MSIQNITTNDLRWMEGNEGLVLQGCGGDPKEWLDGINNLLTEAGIFQNGTKFQDALVFQNNGLTNILFPFRDDMEINMGKMAMWRIQSHSQFGGTWLSDYVPNQLSGFQNEQSQRQKPDCPMIGADGNVFNLMGMASRALKEAGMKEEAREMCQRVYASESYGCALNIMGEYVNITSQDETEDLDEDFGMQM